MIISKEAYSSIYTAFVILIGCLLIFRLPATYSLWLFVLFNIANYKHLNYNRTKWIFIVIIASPFLLDLLFLWNNSSLTEGIKHAEKRTALLLFPILIIGQDIRLNLKKILRYYSIITTAIMVVVFIRFVLVYPDLFYKYLAGKDLWEMGYKFGDSMGMHAPALNMHIAFVTVTNFYFFIKSFEAKKKFVGIVANLVILLLSIFILLYINTRLAIVNAFIGFLIVILYRSRQRFSPRKTGFLLLTGIFLSAVMFFAFSKMDPHIIDKYSGVTFAHIDKTGRLDEVENPEATIFNSLVTRLSIWKAAGEVAVNNLPLGAGAGDGKHELNDYYTATNQKFLAKYEFPVHNQLLDFLLKFGILGALVFLIFILFIAFLGLKTEESLILFFFWLFFTSNMMDDFLIRFDGITFSALWISLFAHHYLCTLPNKDRSIV